MNRIPALPLLLTAVLTLLGGSAAAYNFSTPWLGDVTFFGSESFYYARNSVLDYIEDMAPYDELRNRIALNFQGKNWTLGAELWTQKYWDQEDVPPTDFRQVRTFHAQKRFFEYRHELFTARLGTYYASLGRSICLYVQRDESLNVDDPLDGGFFTLLTNSIQLTVLGGEVMSSQNFEEYLYKDLVYGGHARVSPVSGLWIGAMGVGIEEDSDLGVPRTFTTIGGDLQYSLPSGMADFYVEYQDLRIDDDPVYDSGSALYASLILNFAGVVIQGEYKDYEDWIHPYTNPPNADREDEPNEFQDVVGPRVKVSYLVLPTDSLLYVSYGAFENHEGGIEQTHIYGGVDQRTERLDVSVTYGEIETEDTSSPTFFTDETQQRFTVDGTYALTDHHSLTLHVETKKEIYESLNRRTGFRYKQTTDLNSSSLGYTLSPFLTVTAHYAWDRQWKIESAADLWAGEVTYQPWDVLTFKLFYGEMPGGIVCSGGVCREIPDFDGWKFETVFRF